jgi:hypothetical protein
MRTRNVGCDRLVRASTRWGTGLTDETALAPPAGPGVDGSLERSAPESNDLSDPGAQKSETGAVMKAPVSKSAPERWRPITVLRTTRNSMVSPLAQLGLSL